MSEGIIISCAVTGAIHVPSQSPYLPITPKEIAGNAIGVAEAGGGSVHIHVRNPETGEPTMTPEERMVGVKTFEPELASINMGSINFGLFPAMARIREYKYDWEEPYLERSKDNVFKNTFYDQERIFKIMQDTGTKPEMECYDMAHLYNTAYWVDKGVIEPPFWLQLIFGIMGGIQPSVEDLVYMKTTADKLFGKDYIWSTLAAGRHEYDQCTAGIIMGGHARVGMEDNLYLGEMVEKMVRIIRELDREPISPDKTRQVLGLKGKGGTAFS
ncbi:MAG: 3-keto-5-aminohexanoate cleavage protein [Deltaproteobacteria bacterium]|nr:3-keto-5-aminohexanoate cleavage protein [Deltaproteobacteria bacterium]